MTGPRPHITAVGEVLVSLQAPAGSDLAGTDTLDLRIAGAEANFAAAFVRAGGTAALCSAVGSDPLGDQVLRRLSGYGVDVAGVRRDPTRPTAVMLNQRHAEERQVFYYRTGSAASALTVSDVLADSTGRVVLSGVTFAVAENLRTGVDQLLAGLQLAGRELVLDVNLRPKLGNVDAVVRAIRAAAGAASMVFVGLDEAGPVFGVDEPAALVGLIGDSGAEVIVTDGARGSWVSGQHLPAVPTTVVDPVGAGDAFAGTYCALRAFGESELTAGRVAAQVAAQVVSTPGDLDGLPTAMQVQQLLARWG